MPVRGDLALGGERSASGGVKLRDLPQSKGHVGHVVVSPFGNRAKSFGDESTQTLGKACEAGHGGSFPALCLQIHDLLGTATSQEKLDEGHAKGVLVRRFAGQGTLVEFGRAVAEGSQAYASV